MSGSSACPECGSAGVDRTTEGLCPQCLMAAALRGGAAAEAPELAPTLKSGQPFVPPSPQSLSRSFPQLQILEMTGCGGMGAVYKARQTRLDRIVALKIVRPDTASDPMFTVRFDREARALAKLNHPNIVGVHDFGDVDFIAENGQPAGTLYYFLMEFVDGVNLRQLIQAGETKPAQALQMTLQICEALQYAHSQGVIHRDVKPENILLDTNGHVKIADFGLAKLGGESEDQRLTGTRQVLGTVQYMAPEQMTQSRTVDHRADIYSMGVVFYEMLTGEIPVGAFEPPSKRADIDARLDEVVMRTLASDPDQRYQSAADVGSRISSLSAVGDAPAQPQQSPQWRGPSTIIDDGVAALAAGVRNMLVPPEPDDYENLGRSDVTLTLQQVASDVLPDVCVVCGRPTPRRLSREFQYTADWASAVIVVLMLLFFPLGIAAAVLLTKKVRATLPVCAHDVRHWSRMEWFAGLGWTMILIGVAVAFWLVDFHVGNNVPLFVGCVLAGIGLYLIPLIYLGSTRVSATRITDTDMTFKRVSVGFARAVARLKPDA